MNVIGHELGRVIVLFPMEEIRPETGIPELELFEGIMNRYKFAKTPDLKKTAIEVSRAGYNFELGSFVYEDKSTSIKEFTIYNDGISVSCHDTAHAEACFDNILTWARKEFGLKEFVREPKRLYRSQVVVEFEKSLNRLVQNFSDISSLINLTYRQHTGHDAPINLNRLDFRMDDTKIPGINPMSFILERRIGVSHETERYISEAPISSRAHIQLLQSIEDKLP